MSDLFEQDLLQHLYTPKTRLMFPFVDFVFKGIFGTEENKDILAAFLNRVLRLTGDQRLTPASLTLLNPNQEKQHRVGKRGVLDLLVKFADGTSCNVEVQVVNYRDMCVRPLYYLTKTFSSQLNGGEDYLDLKECISVNILCFRLFPELERCHSVFHLWEDETRLKLTDLVELHYLELPKLGNGKGMDDPALPWLKFLEGISDEELKELAMEEPLLTKAREVQEHLSQDRDARMAYELSMKGLRDEVARRVRMERQEAAMAEQERVLAEQERVLAEQERVLAEKERVLAEQNQALAQKDQALAQKDQALAQKDQALADNAQELRRLSEELELEKVLARRKSILAYLETRFGPAAPGLEPAVTRIESSAVLDAIIARLYESRNLEEAERILNSPNEI